MKLVLLTLVMSGRCRQYEKTLLKLPLPDKVVSVHLFVFIEITRYRGVSLYFLHFCIELCAMLLYRKAKHFQAHQAISFSIVLDLLDYKPLGRRIILGKRTYSF